MPIECRELMSLVPHRIPFLMIDRVEEIESGKHGVATKNVTITEPCFTGHFPGNPIVPGVLIIEALAQLAGLDLFHEVARQILNPTRGLQHVGRE